jgi:phage terminase large subunit-like protein
VFIGIAKGNDKTEGTARFGVAEMMGPVAPLRSPRVVLTAASYDQTAELFQAARLAILGDPDHDRPGPLAPFFRTGDHIREDRILLPNGVGRIERLAAVGGTNDGGKPTSHLGDEIHELDTERKERTITVQGKSLRKRGVPRRTPASLGLPPGVVLSGAQQVGITTAGFSLNSLAGRLYEYGKAVASGEVVDPGFLFLWWEADEEWNLEDPEQLVQAILQGNPAAGGFLPIRSIVASYRDVTVPSYEFLRYNLNRWPGDALRWMPRRVWDSCAGDPVMRRDLPVFAVVTVSHDHRTAAIAIAQKQDDTIALRVRNFPREKLAEGELVDVAELEAHLRVLHQRYPTRVLAARRGWTRPGPVAGPEIVYHGAFFEGSAQRLAREGLAFVDIPDTLERLAPASESLKGAALETVLVHDGDTELARQMGEVLAVPAAKGWNIHESGPAARAAFVAVHRAQSAPKPPSRTMHHGPPR